MQINRRFLSSGKGLSCRGGGNERKTYEHGVPSSSKGFLSVTSPVKVSDQLPNDI